MCQDCRAEPCDFISLDERVLVRSPASLLGPFAWFPDTSVASSTSAVSHKSLSPLDDFLGVWVKELNSFSLMLNF